MKYGPDTFTNVLDGICTYASLGKAAAHAGVDSWTVGRWRKRSEDGDEGFQEVEYRGIIQPFHRHVEDCIEHSIDEVESNVRASARDGVKRPVVYRGEYAFEPDEFAESLNEKDLADMVELGVCWADKKKRVYNEATETWERVKILEWIQPSVDLQIKVLSSWSERYADKRSLKVDMDVRQSLGVTVIKNASLAPPPMQLEIINEPIADAINEATSEAIYSEIDEQPEQPEPVEPPPPVAPSPPVASPPPVAPAEQPSPETVLDAERAAIAERMRSPSPIVRHFAEKAYEAMNRPPPDKA
jgi:hypothetical protein